MGMEILVIDGQGGGLGARIVESLRKGGITADIIAVGANSVATQAMLKAGADRSATGENPVRVCSRTADIIVGPIGIVIADSMLGEITPAMAAAVASSSAERVLIPVNYCRNHIMGIEGLTIAHLIQEAVSTIKKMI